MSTAIPPAPPPAPSSSTGGGGPVSVAVVSNAAAVADLVEGAIVEAQAQARAAKGVIEVMTANGPVQLKASGPLPPIPEGATLLLQLVNKDGEATFRLLAINGRPLAGVTLAGLTLPGGPSMGGLLAPGIGAGTSAAFQPGMGQPGVIQPGATPQPGLPGTVPGTTPLGLTATIIRPALAPGSAISPGSAAAPGTPFAPAAAFAPGQPIVANPPGALTGGLPFDLPAGTQITVRIAGIGMPQPEAGASPFPGAPPGSPTAPQAASGAPHAGTPPPGVTAPTLPAITTPPTTPLLSGTVTAQPPGGNAVVQTPVGTLAVPTQMDLLPGTPLTLEVVGKPLPPPPLPAQPPSRPEGLTAQGWPALTQTMEALTTGNQTQAMEQLLRAIPQASPRMAASMALFAGALRNGETRALVPESAIRGLEKAGKKELAERLTADLGDLAKDAARPVGNGEWRSLTLPFLNGAVIEPIHLYVRGATEGGSQRKTGGTGNDERFVLDIKLTQLGRVQMDGLVRREDKLFDLIIRTDSPLPAETRHGILGIFTNSSELVGTKGSVSFHSGGRWVEFPPAPPAPTRIEV